MKIFFMVELNFAIIRRGSVLAVKLENRCLKIIFKTIFELNDKYLNRNI